MNVSPELEAPEQQGSRLRGVIGALLGAFLGAFVCDLFLYLFSDTVGAFVLWGNLLLVGWTACWGYRLLGGFRSTRFAQWTVRGSALMGNLLAVIPAHTLADLWWWYGTLWVRADILYDTVSHAVDHMRNGLILWVILALGSIFCCQYSLMGILLKYTDPVWYSDPRRLARIGGGATFNMVPSWPLPANEHIPSAFEVARGKLSVDGETITVKRAGKPLQIFSVNDVAGVVLGEPNGCNILYDRNNKVLARFAWSRKNAVLFGQYLIGRGISLVDVNGNPVPATLGAVERQNVSWQFTVRDGKLCLALGWIGEVIFCGFLVVDILFLDGVDRVVYGAGILLFVGMYTWMLLSHYRRRLSVDGEELTYTTTFKRTTRFRISDVDSVMWGRVACSRLKDREGKTLARFEWDMENYELLIAYLKAHSIERKK